MKRKIFIILIVLFTLYLIYSITPPSFSVSIDAHNVSVGEFQAFEIAINVSSPILPKLPLSTYHIKIKTNLKNPSLKDEFNRTLIFEIKFKDMKKTNDTIILENAEFQKSWAFIYVTGTAVPNNYLQFYIISKILFVETVVRKFEKNIVSF
jgi:hypothetical protein